VAGRRGRRELTHGQAAPRGEPAASVEPTSATDTLALELRDGRLEARVAGRVPLAEAAAGMRFAERRGVVGKVVLTSGAPR
jgi:hypothetical protein